MTNFLVKIWHENTLQHVTTVYTGDAAHAWTLAAGIEKMLEVHYEGLKEGLWHAVEEIKEA